MKNLNESKYNLVAREISGTEFDQINLFFDGIPDKTLLSLGSGIKCGNFKQFPFKIQFR